MTKRNHCPGHEPEPAGPDPMGISVYCDGSCRVERCASCDAPLTREDVAANADDAEELTGGRACRRCMTQAGGIGEVAEARASSGSECPRCGGERRIRYPGGDPENGAARPECPDAACQGEQDAEAMEAEGPSYDDRAYDDLPLDPEYEAHVATLEAARMPPGMSLDVIRGTEGPSHDPWGFVIYRVRMPWGGRIAYRSGMTESLYVDGTEVALATAPNPSVALRFEALVGFDCDQLEWWHGERHAGAPCMACGRTRCHGRCAE